MRLTLLGVRGSTPAPGADFVRYGGHTSCLAVTADGHEAPSLVLDAGTGVRDLPRLLGGRPFEGAVVLSHLHWDHLHGLPFCPALDHADSRVQLWLPAPATPRDDEPHAARDLLARVMSPPHFPIGPEGLLGAWDFRLAAPGRLPVADPHLTGADVRVAPVLHKGGTTFAIRIELDGASVAYVPDHTLSPQLPGSPQVPGSPRVPGEADDAAAIELVHGVDLLLHDGQFVQAEARLAAAYGHSTVEDVMTWADRCETGAVVITHHGPARTDAQLDELAARFTRTPQGRPVSFARQGETLAVVPGAG